MCGLLDEALDETLAITHHLVMILLLVALSLVIAVRAVIRLIPTSQARDISPFSCDIGILCRYRE